MGASMTPQRRADLLNSVGKHHTAGAKLTDNQVVRAARLIKLAVSRSGVQFKALGDDKGQTTKKVSGTTDHKLWFHEMLATWPADVWCELLPLIALEVCPGRFTVKRTIAIEETLKERSA